MTMSTTKDQHEDRRGWHLSREISISHMFTTGTIVIACVTGWVKLEERVSSIEREQVRLQRQITDNDTKIDKKLHTIAESMRRIEDKVYVIATEQARKQR